MNKVYFLIFFNIFILSCTDIQTNHIGENGNSCYEDGSCDLGLTCIEEKVCVSICIGVNCSNHGSCIVENDSAVCNCDNGYSTTEGKQVCLFDCSNILNSHANQSNDECLCNAGYHKDNNNCISDNRCLDNSCNEHGLCKEDNGAISCNCDENYEGLRCSECASNFHKDNEECISNIKQVDCKIITPPENSKIDIVKVDINWDDETNSWNEPSNCEWSCNDNYHTEDDLNCISNKKEIECTHNDIENATEVIEDVEINWENGWSVAENCLWSCDEGYQDDDNNNSCEYTCNNNDNSLDCQYFCETHSGVPLCICEDYITAERLNNNFDDAYSLPFVDGVEGKEFKRENLTLAKDSCRYTSDYYKFEADSKGIIKIRLDNIYIGSTYTHISWSIKLYNSNFNKIKEDSISLFDSRTYLSITYNVLESETYYLKVLISGDSPSRQKYDLLVKVQDPCDLKQFNNNNYLFCSRIALKWSDAKEYCISKNKNLVTIENELENSWISSEIEDDSWIGLNDIDEESSWIWSKNSEPLGEYQNWKSGEPNNNDNEDCVEIYSNSKKWNDKNCSSQKNFICE